MGDPAGIGPEITLRTVADAALREVCQPAIIGDLRYLNTISRMLDLPVELATTDENPNAVRVFDLANLPESFEIGVNAPETGRASAEYIVRAVELANEGAIDAIATAPISKKAISLGGYDFPGHTEFLAELTNTKRFAMSFFAGPLRVVLLSTHISLRAAIDLVQTKRLVDLIVFSSNALTELLGRKPRLAMAGLNPHASEGGMFGTEEADEIEPAVRVARDRFGVEISGPYSPDTVFLRTANGEFDAAVACYHDQATIAVKASSFGSAVNVTLGLPVIRTSVDHGTAFDIVGKRPADASSMAAAVRLAAELAAIRRSDRIS